MKKIIAGLLLIMSALYQPVNAAEETNQAIPYDLNIYSESGIAYVRHSASGCSGVTYYLEKNHPGYEPIFSTLIAAQISNRNIVIRFDGCSANNQGKIIGVYLK